MSALPKMPFIPTSELVTALLEARQKVAKVLESKVTFKVLWTFGEYLDTAAQIESEKNTDLYKQVIAATTQFLESNAQTDWVLDIAADSWAINELLEAELARDELELTLSASAVPVSTRLALESLYEGFQEEYI